MRVLDSFWNEFLTSENCCVAGLNDLLWERQVFPDEEVAVRGLVLVKHVNLLIQGFKFSPLGPTC